ncbi:4-alpha-glucanotransferase [Fusobacterium sp. PH5-44]|uniref:4-alpha-glucanotransferase n=1 Tax=unclassified Fusobacterium TaxID=2648384 RepID=UPI003D193AC1
MKEDRISNINIYERGSGVLLHVSSLPSEFGIGDMGKAAYDFIDFLHETKQKYWQILPMGPLGHGNSPYQSLSIYAGAYVFIDPIDLVNRDYVTDDDLNQLRNINIDGISSYEEVGLLKGELLRKSYERFLLLDDYQKEDYLNFIYKNDYWLDNYSLYMLIKEENSNSSWYKWKKEFRFLKNIKKIKENFNKNKKEYYKFVQYIFYRQWYSLKQYANSLGIKIIGDLPIFVSADSVDVWENQRLFQLSKYGLPKRVAGCPPDYFSKTGQLWGNVLYDWSAMKKDDYNWWKNRLSHCLEMYDVIRIDHFRGFEAYWTIPYGAKTAVNGKWEKGPNIDFFRKLSDKLGYLAVIAEDLGIITDKVKKLLHESRFPGMKVLEFAFDSPDNDYLPHKYNENCVGYTGTHDNDTVVGWYSKSSKKIQDYCNGYFEWYLMTENPMSINEKFIFSIWKSKCNIAIAPLQDLCGIGSEGRMNVPSTVNDNNWRWRAKKEMFTSNLKNLILYITEKTNRSLEESNEN